MAFLSRRTFTLKSTFKNGIEQAPSWTCHLLRSRGTHVAVSVSSRAYSQWSSKNSTVEMSAKVEVPSEIVYFNARVHGYGDALEEIKAERPQLKPHDILVKNHAVATNPVDLKKLSNYGNVGGAIAGSGLTVGYDASGVVAEVGSEVTEYKVGDEVYYAGVINRPGSFAQFTAVDERIVGRKPKTLSHAHAASVPLTALTAWEGLVEQLRIPVPKKEEKENPNQGKTILVINGAGGVGSFVIQIAKKILGLTVIATASREETIKWCKAKGADHIITHKKTFLPQLKELKFDAVDYVFNCSNTDDNFDECTSVVAPFGAIVLITGANKNHNIQPLMLKRATLTWELMFTRGLTGVQMEKQREILNTFAKYLDEGVFTHNATKVFPFTLAGLKSALAIQREGTAIGKIALGEQ